MAEESIHSAPSVTCRSKLEILRDSSPFISLTTSKMEVPSVGIIGMGLMGRMYAKRFSEAGYR